MAQRSSSSCRLLLHVGTRLGVRIECLEAETALGEASVPFCWVLHHENGFRSERVRVQRWNARACRVRRVSRAVFEVTGDQEDEDEDEEEAAASSRPKTATHHPHHRTRKRPSVRGPDEEATTFHAIEAALRHTTTTTTTLPKARRRVSAPPVWCLELTDTRPEDVGYVWLVHVQYEGAATRSHGQDMTPHAPHDFRIENACGACLVEAPLDLWRLRPFMVRAHPSSRGRRRSASSSLGMTTPESSELIATLSGTFAPCANGMQVDFRGVRSVAAMLEDWRLLIPEQAPARVQLYMMVLKANLGVPVVILDQGRALPPGLGARSLSIAQEGMSAGLCFLATRMRPWCDECGYRSDVCMAVQLIGVRWRALFPEAELSSALRVVRTTSVDVSRRGSVMMRLVFPKDTAWGVDEEAQVVRDCNRLLRVLRAALSGDASLPCDDGRG